MIVSQTPATVAGVFTLNKTQAAPVLVDKLQLKRSAVCSAIIVNSGNANACTGERGMNNAWEMVKATARALNVPETQVMVSSTGVIGQYMPMEKVLPAISELAGKLDVGGNTDAAESIMTTDTFPKEAAVKFTLGDTVVTIGGVAKGSGMIAPNMATMLAFVTTDIAISQELLSKALRSANNRSFNRITVDGDMSTNDMVLVLANGMARNHSVSENSEEYQLFATGLEYVLIKLAKMIAEDGEGATKLIEIMVKGARSEEEAAQAARAVHGSENKSPASFSKGGDKLSRSRSIAFRSGIRFPNGSHLIILIFPLLQFPERIDAESDPLGSFIEKDYSMLECHCQYILQCYYQVFIQFLRSYID